MYCEAENACSAFACAWAYDGPKAFAGVRFGAFGGAAGPPLDAGLFPAGVVVVVVSAAAGCVSVLAGWACVSGFDESVVVAGGVAGGVTCAEAGVSAAGAFCALCVAGFFSTNL